MKTISKVTACSAVLALMTAFGASVGSASAADDPGKAVFAAQKCSLCHSVQSMSIEHTVKTSKAPDLSNVGADKTPEWIEKFLKKEEMLNGKKHQKTFTGTPEELTHLVKWLGTLKK